RRHVATDGANLAAGDGRRVEGAGIGAVERRRRHARERWRQHRYCCSRRGAREMALVEERIILHAVPGRRPARQYDVSVRRAPDTGDYIPSLQNRGERAGTDVRADERAEEDGRLAVAEDVAAVPLVNVEVPAMGWYRRGHVSEYPDCVHDHAMAVGDQVPQHVLDRPLAHAAAKVDVGGVGPRSDPAGADGDGERVPVGVIGDGGPSPRRAIADTGRADFDREEPVRPPGDAAALHSHADHQAAVARQMAGEVALEGAVSLADAIGRERAEPDSPG